MFPPEWSDSNNYATPVSMRSKLRFANPTGEPKRSRVKVLALSDEQNAASPVRLKLTECTDSALECQWTKPVLLYDQKMLKTYQRQGKGVQEFLRDYPINAYSYTLVAHEKGDPSSHRLSTIALTPPSINSLQSTDGESVASLNAGRQYLVNGSHFGHRPKVWLEYEKNDKIRLLRLKVNPLVTNSSPNNPYNGTGTLTITTPKRWPKGWDHSTPHTLVITNRLGLCSWTVNTSK